VRLRDLMTARGPDDAGLWRGEQVVLGHRRLSVVDPTPAGWQPMATPDGRFVVVYNGELYNDAAVREALAGEGVRFRTSCDTETVLFALAKWGIEGLGRLRGMYGLGLYDAAERRLLLARDPLGIKPLYWWRGRVDGHDEVVFASDVRAVIGHPAVAVRPDAVAVSAYLTTIRRALGERTLYEGVRIVEPGMALVVDLSGEDVRVERVRHWDGEGTGGQRDTGTEGGNRAEACPTERRVREVVEESVRLHLRADVETCCLLSGGLDSTIVAGCATERMSGLRTYCAGARTGSDDDDLSCARRVAELLGTAHGEAVLTEGMFIERWRELVGRMALPLSTPNEVAIYEVAKRLRADGCVVTLSGEGADELFGGYGLPMRQAATYVASGNEDPGLFQLLSAAWVSAEAKPAVLSEGAWRAAEGDAGLVSWYREEFARLRHDGEDPMQAHLRFHRRVNLAGLLDRLDTATMLASVEGRTPLADRAVAELAESLPMEWKFGVEEAGAAWTKRSLREAFRESVPGFVMEREKASFPVPFRSWGSERVDILRSSGFAREWFSDAAVEAVCERPEALWALAWPMCNLALWGASRF